MASTPNPEPTSVGRVGAPIQPPPEVPESWLNDVGQLDSADAVDRLAGDVDLVTDLALEQYAGPLWDYFSNELAKYGFAVISAWMRHGLIFQRCRAKGFGGLPATDQPIPADDIAELAGETVAKALRHFKVDVLMKHRWDSRRGATLRTFFIGQCLMRFPNIYRRWYATENRQRLSLPTDEDALLDALGGRRAGPEDQVIAGVISSHAMSTIKDARVRRAMYLRAQGRTHADIAAAMDITTKAVERMLANERARLKKRGIA